MNNQLLRQEQPRWIIEKLIYCVAFAMPLNALAGDIFLWAAIVLAGYDQVKNHKLSKPTGILSWSVMAFLGWTFISSAYSEHHWWSLGAWFYQVLACGGIYYLMRNYIVAPTQWRYFIRAFLSSAVLVCFIGFYEYIFVPNAHMHEWVDAKLFPKLMRRMASTLENPNLLGTYLLMVLSLTGSYILTYWKDKYYKSALRLLPIGILVFITLVLTYSRGIWISFAVMVVYWGIVMERRLLFTLLLIPMVLYWYQGEVAARLWSLFYGQDTSVALRWAIWDSTMYMVKENPLLGIGWNTYWLEYPEFNYFIQGTHVLMYHAHNLYLNILAETGIPGLVLFLTILIGHAIKATRLKGDRVRQAAQYGVGALVISVLVSGLTDFELYSHQVAIVFWQLLGLIGAFMKLSGKEEKEIKN